MGTIINNPTVAGETATTSAARVIAAINKGMEIEPEYTPGCFETRIFSSSRRAGSYYTQFASAGALREAIEKADWQPFEHPAVRAPAVAFKAYIKGVVGVADINTVEPGTVLTMIDPKGGADYHDGKQKVDVVLAGHLDQVASLHSTAIIGPSESQNPDSPEILFAVHPGDPIRPSEVDRHADGTDRHGKTVTVEKAKEMGFTFVKFV